MELGDGAVGIVGVGGCPAIEVLRADQVLVGRIVCEDGLMAELIGNGLD